MSKITWKKGIKIVGNDGKTPKVGEDFFIPDPIPGRPGKDANEAEILKRLIKHIPKPRKGDHGEPGKNADETAILARVFEKLPKTEPVTGEQIVSLLSSLKNEFQLSYDVLKDTPKFRLPSSRDYSFLELTDTPNLYKGNAGKAVKVNSGEDALEFYIPTDVGITSLNGLISLDQLFAFGTAGDDFAISSSVATHTFNLPTASNTKRGALSSTDWETFNNKVDTGDNVSGFVNDAGYITGISGLNHNILGNLTTGDVHTQYALLTGRSGGQIQYMDTISGGGGSIRSTTHATKGKIKIADDGGSVEFGVTPSNLGFVNINAGTSTIPALTINQTPSSSSDIAQAWRANVQKIWSIDQYGITRINQPANANQALEVLTSAYNGGMIANFTNSNTGSGAGFLVKIATSGGGQASISFSANNVEWAIGGYAGRSIRSVFVIAGQGSFGNMSNDMMTAFAQGNGNQLESTQYARYNFGFGGYTLSEDAIQAINGNIHAWNANAFAGELGSESLNEPTLPAGITKWTGHNDCSVLAGGGLKFTFSTGNGYFKQTIANLANGIKTNTKYRLRIVVTGLSGSCNVQINDPTGAFSQSPASIGHPQTCHNKFIIANGTLDLFFKTAPSNLPQDFILKAFGAAAGSTFTITAISLTEIYGGKVDMQGIIAWGIRSITAHKTLDDSARTWLCNATSAAITVTLPAVVNSYRKVYTIKKTDASGNAVTIQANVAETIDGANTKVLAAQYDKVTIQCDGNAWHII